jgi:hypothetical protein
MRTVFFRPIASLSRAFDWLVLGEHPWAMHLHSVLWYGLLVAVAAALYRRLLGSTWAAGLAALLYAVDDAHGVPVGWLANRNGLCAAVFGLLAVGAYAHGRERGSRPAAWLAHAALAASLLSAEAGLAAFLYMGAYIHPARPTPCRARQGPWVTFCRDRPSRLTRFARSPASPRRRHDGAVPQRPRHRVKASPSGIEAPNR